MHQYLQTCGSAIVNSSVSILLPNSTRPHTSKTTCQKLMQLDIEVSPYPSIHLSPTDYIFWVLDACIC